MYSTYAAMQRTVSRFRVCVSAGLGASARDMVIRLTRADISRDLSLLRKHGLP